MGLTYTVAIQAVSRSPQCWTLQHPATPSPKRSQPCCTLFSPHLHHVVFRFPIRLSFFSIHFCFCLHIRFGRFCLLLDLLQDLKQFLLADLLQLQRTDHLAELKTAIGTHSLQEIIKYHRCTNTATADRKKKKIFRYSNFWNNRMGLFAPAKRCSELVALFGLGQVYGAISKLVHSILCGATKLVHSA